MKKKLFCAACWLEIEDPENALKTQYKNKTYYFCSLKCKQRFDENPESFIEEAPMIEENSEAK